MQYVGRSDDCLQARLLVWKAEEKYTAFSWRSQETIEAAYRQECEDYHSFANLDNDIHPDLPEGKLLSCPFCPTQPLSLKRSAVRPPTVPPSPLGGQPLPKLPRVV